jgi:fucose 4-O-acetylase-like acetyltransferase
MGERIGWLDSARAFGIVAVVVGHVAGDGAVRAAMFHFHMPLFFMLSGMVFRPGTARDVARRRARSLLLPYVVWLAIIAAADVVIAGTTGHPTYLPWDRPLVAVARMFLGGTFLVGPFGVFWFVTCLFLVQLAGAAILGRPVAQVLIIAVVTLVAAHLVGPWPNPWGLASVPIALVFFIAGALHRRHADQFNLTLTPLAIAAAALALVTSPLDLKIADLGTPVLSVLAALGLCHLIVLAARYVPAIPPVRAIGAASLVIMYVHLSLFYGLRDRLDKAVIVVIAVVLPVGLWLALRRFDIARALLLGERLGNAAPPRAVELPIGDKRA